MKKLAPVAALAALILSYTQPAFTQSSEELQALRKEIEALKEGQRIIQEIQALKEGQLRIQQDLQEIKTLLRARPAAPPAEPQNVVLNVDGAPFKGEKTAKLTLIDFSDFQ